MKMPGVQAFVLGTALVTLAAAGTKSVYLWWNGRIDDGAALVAVVAAGIVLKASDELCCYRRLCARWEQRDGSTAQPAGRSWTTIRRLLLSAAMALWLYQVATAKGTAASPLLTGLTLSIFLYGLDALSYAITVRIRRRRKATAARKEPPWGLLAVFPQ